MSKPTADELDHAIRKAITMKETGEDPDFLAKTLLNHHYRIRYLEEVLAAADRFMNHGMAEQERLHLLKSIDKAREAEYRTSGLEREDFGLE